MAKLPTLKPLLSAPRSRLQAPKDEAGSAQPIRRAVA